MNNFNKNIIEYIKKFDNNNYKKIQKHLIEAYDNLNNNIAKLKFRLNGYFRIENFIKDTLKYNNELNYIIKQNYKRDRLIKEKLRCINYFLSSYCWNLQEIDFKTINKDNLENLYKKIEKKSIYYFGKKITKFATTTLETMIYDIETLKYNINPINIGNNFYNIYNKLDTYDINCNSNIYEANDYDTSFDYHCITRKIMKDDIVKIIKENIKNQKYDINNINNSIQCNDYTYDLICKIIDDIKQNNEENILKKIGIENYLDMPILTYNDEKYLKDKIYDEIRNYIYDIKLNNKQNNYTDTDIKNIKAKDGDGEETNEETKSKKKCKTNINSFIH